MSAQSVNTTKSPRRTIRFNSIDDAIAEARRIAALDQSGNIRYAGKWSAGQILNHCGAWAEYAYMANPLKAPWFVRLLGGMMKQRLLAKGFPAGRNIPRVPGGTLHTEPVDTVQALARFAAAYQRLTREAPTHPSPVFGRLTQDEAIRLNLRHAELHMSFVAN